MRDLENSARIFLISPMRYGKTSLAANALERLKRRNVFTAYLDFYDVTTLEQFAAHYARAIARACETKTEAVIHFIRDLIPSLRPNVTINPEGEVSITVEAAPKKSEFSLVLKDVLEIPQKVAEKKKRRFAVVFDEFQEVRTVGGETLEKMMRAVFQRQKDVGYLFAGSKRHLMSDMVLNKNKPFYKMGKVVFLGKIPLKDLRDFIAIKFEVSGKNIKAEALDDILRLSCAIPYHTFHLCHEIWNDCAGGQIIGAGAVAPALENIIVSLSPIYLSSWDALTLAQRHLLQAIAISGGMDLFSKDFINTHCLGSASSVQKSVKLLINKEVLEKENGNCQFADIWFGEWVKKRAV
ncbi:MAG: ATP-binding protein [Elusimicrobia bacterium]|nr:ATP-binding protein [Elusimicrobiota bacterium]